MKGSPALALIVGLWLGSTLAVLGIVGWSFAGIPHALESNERLATRTDFDPEVREERRASSVHVYAAELNRGIFWGWNRTQLVLAALALLVATLKVPRPVAIVPLMVAGAIVIALTFWLAPELESLGRTLDFVPRSSADRAGDFARFGTLHRLYTALEGVKTLALLVAGGAALRSGEPPG